MQVLAEIMVNNTSAFLMFDDAVGAQKSLASLQAKKQVTKAILFDKSKIIFASHINGSDSGVTYESIKRRNDSGNKVFYVWQDVIIYD